MKPSEKADRQLLRSATQIVEKVPPQLAVLIPCFNEESTIATVIDDFRREVPDATIYVFDNGSTDRTADNAARAGASVFKVSRQGKGSVVRSMLTRIDADIYVLVDGDDTYPANSLPALLAPILSGKADMAVGARLSDYADGAFRPLHHIGNRVFCDAVNLIFRASLRDILSGYRVFTADVARRLAVVSNGFEVEAEMTIQCLYQGFAIEEVGVPYRARPEGSVSKLATFRDGAAILLKIFHLFRAYKSLTFFGLLGILCILGALLCGVLASNNSTPAGMVASYLLSVFGAVLVCTGILLHTLNFRIMELEVLLSQRRHG